jgi:hypothetical protein
MDIIDPILTNGLIENETTLEPNRPVMFIDVPMPFNERKGYSPAAAGVSPEFLQTQNKNPLSFQTTPH